MWRLIVANQGDESWMNSEHPSQESAVSQREKILRDERRGQRRKKVAWTAIVRDRQLSASNA